MYVIQNSRNPNIVTNAVCMCGAPKWHVIAKYIKLINSVIITTIAAAINFPNTIFVMLSGDVNNNCSVPDFLSSENDLIVNNGIITANTIIVGNE